MIPTLINERWTLNLPEHRASRPNWANWERETLAYLWAMIRPGDVVWDIGAEEGDLSALYASWGARVCCVEPSPYAWPWIKQTFDANGQAMEAGSVSFCGPTASTAIRPDFDATPDANRWPACASDPGYAVPDYGFRCMNGQTDTTPVVPLDELPFPHPDLVCMDIEGAEYQAILGATGLLKTWRPTFMISVHPEFMRETFGDTPDDLHTHFELAGYTSHYVAYDHEQHWIYKPS